MSFHWLLFLLVMSHPSFIATFPIISHGVLAIASELPVISSRILLHLQCWLLPCDSDKLLHISWTVSRPSFPICQCGSRAALRLYLIIPLGFSHIFLVFLLWLVGHRCLLPGCPSLPLGVSSHAHPGPDSSRASEGLCGSPDLFFCAATCSPPFLPRKFWLH